MTRANFELALKKGRVGERIVKKELEKKGWIVYQPTTEGAHSFDMLSIKDKERAIAIDVKAKSRMNDYPATGINQSHFLIYLQFSNRHKMPFWLFFVDEALGVIYGNSIEELEKSRNVGGNEYPFVMKKCLRLWPLCAMKIIAKLSSQEINELKALSQRNYSQPGENKIVSAITTLGG